MADLPLFDICARRHKGAETSVTAFASTPASRRDRQRRLIVEAVQASEPRGLTCDEAEVVTGLSHQSCSARCSELRAESALAYLGEKRPTRTGRPALVHHCGPEAGRYLPRVEASG